MKLHNTIDPTKLVTVGYTLNLDKELSSVTEEGNDNTLTVDH